MPFLSLGLTSLLPTPSPTTSGILVLSLTDDYLLNLTSIQLSLAFPESFHHEKDVVGLCLKLFHDWLEGHLAMSPPYPDQVRSVFISGKSWQIRPHESEKIISKQSSSSPMSDLNKSRNAYRTNSLLALIVGSRSAKEPTQQTTQFIILQCVGCT